MTPAGGGAALRAVVSVCQITVDPRLTITR
jgi:hypothetical protein